MVLALPRDAARAAREVARLHAAGAPVSEEQPKALSLSLSPSPSLRLSLSLSLSLSPSPSPSLSLSLSLRPSLSLSLRLTPTLTRWRRSRRWCGGCSSGACAVGWSSPPEIEMDSRATSCRATRPPPRTPTPKPRPQP